jgi:hypothetical protein
MRIVIIDFIKHHPIQTFILLAMIFETIDYVFLCNQDYEKWKNSLKLKFTSFMLYGGLPVLFYLLIEYIFHG